MTHIHSMINNGLSAGNVIIMVHSLNVSKFMTMYYCKFMCGTLMELIKIFFLNCLYACNHYK